MNSRDIEEEILCAFKELAMAGAELAGVVSCTEIRGGIQLNREKIRELCDKVLDLTVNLSKVGNKSSLNKVSITN